MVRNPTGSVCKGFGQPISHFGVRGDLSMPHSFWRLQAWHPAIQPFLEGPDMRAHRIVLSLAIPVTCGILTQTPVAAEEYRGTLEQQMACTPDVWRLCFDQMPDVSRITACLRQNTPQLSGGCRAVFESNAQVPDPVRPRGRNEQPKSYSNQ
jgi:hypothetical protein